MRITTEHFKNETYECYECRKEIGSEDVNRETWECVVCGEKVIINIGKSNGVLVRLTPGEVTETDSVLLQSDGEFHDLKGINIKNKKYYFGVAGYRMVEVKFNEFVNCMWRDQ
ncbi:hypothetical protein [Bacillus toyonensis]|uniref:hypothetical protein n=1 Tax=Bacillus toyonensis TaxID=155322 RepID=UPI0021CF926A|nr:hypothetical protein [Bacillus toyonensis]MCU4770745.1 hypothetical protein [Bacillus toyonensis]